MRETNSCNTKDKGWSLINVGVLKEEFSQPIWK